MLQVIDVYRRANARQGEGAVVARRAYSSRKAEMHRGGCRCVAEGATLLRGRGEGADMWRGAETCQGGPRHYC